MFQEQRSIKKLILKPILAGVFGILIGGIFILFTDVSPFLGLKTLITSGFSCQSADSCVLYTTLQYTTPLILSGLSAAVAFRAGIFSIGQAGQMLLGASMANYIAGLSGIPAHVHPALALLGACLIGGLYAVIPGILKITLNINEIIVTIIMNSIAGYLVGMIPSGWGHYIPESARLVKLAAGTKLNSGFFIALGVLFAVYLFLWHTGAGYEIRMSGQAKKFARAGGINPVKSIVIAMLASGALAGLAGGIEVLGVHYHFVSNFSGSDNFDGLAVALMGQCHPLGIFLAALFLGGVRLASLTGLSVGLGIPRSIGGMMIAAMMVVMGMDYLYEGIFARFSRWVLSRFRKKEKQSGV